MGRGRLGTHVDRIREQLYDAFTEDYTSREFARSFATGAFITMLPTFGLGLGLFVVIVAVFDRVSKLALLASVLVFNPVVKWGVYAASFALGVALLGPVEGLTLSGVSLDAGTDVLVRLLVGNLILAVVATILSYVIVYRLSRRFATTRLAERIDDDLETLAEDVVRP